MVNPPDLQYFRRGFFTVPAVQLSKDNLWQVFEWADSKPFFGPKQDGDTEAPITGLTVFEPTGRNKASWGDWVYQTPAGHFRTYPDAEFRDLFQAVPAGQEA